MEQEGGNDLEDGAAHNTITRREHAAHQLFQRSQDSDHIFRGARLFQELLCDQYATMEQAKLHWYRTHQREIRADLYSGLTVSHDLTVANRMFAVIVRRRNASGVFEPPLPFWPASL